MVYWALASQVDSKRISRYHYYLMIYRKSRNLTSQKATVCGVFGFITELLMVLHHRGLVGEHGIKTTESMKARCGPIAQQYTPVCANYLNVSLTGAEPVPLARPSLRLSYKQGNYKARRYG